MYIGTQFGCRHDTDIQVLAQLGVLHVDQTPAEPWTEWTADTLKTLRDRFARHGIEVEMIHVPLSARSALADAAGAIFLGPSDARDRQIERMCETVRMAAAAGLRGINYNITLLGHLRTAPRYGRGGAALSSFELAKLDRSRGEFESGAADEDTMWERIDHWLRNIMPVAEEYGIQMACHPSDPGIGYGVRYRGVARVLGMVDGFKKLIELYDTGKTFPIGSPERIEIGKEVYRIHANEVITLSTVGSTPLMKGTFVKKKNFMGVPENTVNGTGLHNQGPRPETYWIDEGQ